MTNTTDQPTGTLGSDTSTSKSAPLSPTSLVGALKQKAAAGGKRNTTIIAAVAIALAVIYIAGTVFFSSHFVYGTTVNGIDASGLTTTELAKLVDDETSSFSTHVTGDGLDFTINAKDIEMKADSQALAKDALEGTSPFAWPATLISHPIITSKVGITYNREPLAQAVSDAVGAYNEGATPPTNATATFDAETKTYKIVPMQLGTQVNGDAVTEAVENSIKTLSPTTTLNEKQLQEPDILEDNPNLAAAAEQATKVAGISIPLTRNGETLATVDPDLIVSWIDVRETEEGGVEVHVNQDAIYEWSANKLSGAINGEDETTAWEVDSWGVANALAPKIASADSSPMDIPTSVTVIRPEESEGHETRGRHIDINLTTQYARLYDDDGRTVLWRSPIVTGDVSWGHETPEGEYEINNMEEGAVLTGLNNGVVIEEGQEPPEDAYYNSYVDFWMPFIGDSVGLHDATWRYEEEFGGDTYMWNGSHGCVNLPWDAAESLYNQIHVGDKVYVHY